MDINEIAIFGVGTWNGAKFTAEDLAEIVRNTNILIEKGELKPPIKLGHSTNQILKGQSDGDPRLGSVVRFKVKGDKIVADFVNVPDIIIQAIKAERFDQVSVEMRNIPHVGWFIHGVALLGGDLPAVKTLDGLSAYLTETLEPGAFQSDNIEKGILLNFAEGFIDLSETKDNQQGYEMAEKNEATERLLELERQLLAEKTRAAELEAKNNRLQASESDRQFADDKEKFLSKYRDEVKAGKLKPAVLDKLSAHIDAQKGKYSENGIQFSAELVDELSKGYAESLPANESASDNGKNTEDEHKTPDKKVEEHVYSIMAKNSNLDYIAAADLSFKTNPELWREYYAFANHVHRGPE